MSSLFHWENWCHVISDRLPGFNKTKWKWNVIAGKMYLVNDPGTNCYLVGLTLWIEIPIFLNFLKYKKNGD